METIHNIAGFKTDQTYYVACKVGLFFRWKLLLIREEPRKEWEIPGGKRSKADFWNDILTTLKREVQEELGFDIAPYEEHIRFIGTAEYERIFDNENSIFFLLYICEIDELPEFHLSGEHTAQRWITEDEIEQVESWRPGFKEIVKRCFATKKKGA